ncbi:iron complex outermembrane recepter protein [Pseudomonas cichorii]|uniref:TonB-dependent receptor n=2 Tax=Pseudomonas cichorii TaxID=36746 RepID=A0ABQ1DSP3_PSECI|nr:TonB-dependent receptor [Pseudomonas cichorii]GFM94050.1 TonB-dependent receptor [Pseudomonas cichorii]SDO96916.1 iron complex outermembrane recepter protein [Pseudomonas cichorii]
MAARRTAMSGWLSRTLFVVVGVCVQSAVCAAQQTFDFSIPAKPLPQALSEFSRVTGLSVIYTQDAPYRIDAPTLRGRFSAEQALGTLLRDSGLAWRRASEQAFTLETLKPEAGTLSLAATHIDSRLAERGLYQPPSSSSVLRSSAPLLETPQSIDIVPQQVLRDQAPRNLDDALSAISGVTQGNTLGSTQDTLMKRGFGDNRDGSIMRNSMPVVQGRNLNATAERVEILKGPASLLYGIQDPGGVINVVSKQPQLQAANSLTARGSSYGSGKNGSGVTLDSTGPVGDSALAWRMIVDHQDEDYWRNFGTHRESLVAPSLAWYGEDTQWVAAYEHREFLYPFDRGTAIDPVTNHPLDIPATRRLDEPFNNMEGRSDLYRFEADHDFNERWKGHLGYSYNRETYDASQVRVTAVNAANGTLTRSMDGTSGALATDRYTVLTLAGDVQWAGLRHELLMGLDDEYRKVYRSDLIRQRSLTTFSYLNPVYGQEVEGTAVSEPDSAQSDILRSNSLFLQDSVHLNEQWILVAGARFMTFDQVAGRGRPFSVNTDTNGSQWIPRAGLVYRYTDQLSFYGSYSESFKPNSSIAPLTGGYVLDSGTLPEQAKAWELGAKWDVPGAFSATVALYDIQKRNVLVANYDAVTASTVYSSAGEVRSRGLELDLSGQLSERWSLIGGYAFTDARVQEDPLLKGKHLQNVARHSGSLSAVYDVGSVLGGDRLRLGAGAHYVGERAGNPLNDFNLPAYTVADAFATYDTRLDGQKVRFQLNVKNLFDRTYYTSSVNRYFVSMGDSRQVQISTTLEF